MREIFMLGCTIDNRLPIGLLYGCTVGSHVMLVPVNYKRWRLQV